MRFTGNQEEKSKTIERVFKLFSRLGFNNVLDHSEVLKPIVKEWTSSEDKLPDQYVTFMRGEVPFSDNVRFRYDLTVDGEPVEDSRNKIRESLQNWFAVGKKPDESLVDDLVKNCELDKVVLSNFIKVGDGTDLEIEIDYDRMKFGDIRDFDNCVCDVIKIHNKFSGSVVEMVSSRNKNQIDFTFEWKNEDESIECKKEVSVDMYDLRFADIEKITKFFCIIKGIREMSSFFVEKLESFLDKREKADKVAEESFDRMSEEMFSS